MTLSFSKHDLPDEPSLPTVGNPFATRYTRPNAGPYLFPDGHSTDSLLARLRDNGWWGQITGPHGSGKSTLVYTLLPRLQAAGRRVEIYSLHRRDSIASWNASTQIVVDGCEQLGWLQRTWLKWTCRRRGTGLLATAHRDVGLPPLWTAETGVELAQRIVTRLLGQGDAGWLHTGQVERLFAEHRGNMRELLFALYDLYEQRNAGGM